MSDYTETVIKVIVSGIKKGLYIEQDGRIMLQILTNAGVAAQNLAANLEQSRRNSPLFRKKLQVFSLLIGSSTYYKVKKKLYRVY